MQALVQLLFAESNLCILSWMFLSSLIFFIEISCQIFIKPHNNLFKKYTIVERFPCYLLSYNHGNINIIPYGENKKIQL